MKSIILLTVGIIAGIAGTLFTYSSSIQEEPITNIAIQKPKPVTPSPFTPIAKTAESESEPTHTAINTTTPSAKTTPDAPLAIADIKHYRELIIKLQHLDSADSNTLKSLSRELPNNFYDHNFSNAIHTAIYQRWAEVDIDDALTHAVDLLKNDNRRYAHNPMQAITLLATSEPEYVKNWISNYAADNPALLNAAYTGMASKDPEAFIKDYLSTTSADDLTSGDQFGTVHSALMQWAQQDPQAALAFLDSEPALGAMEGMKENLLYIWFEIDPDAAIVEIETLVNDPNTPSASLMMISDLYAARLAESDPESALQWAMSQQDPMLRESTLMNIIYSWDHNDADSLMSFLDQLPEVERQSLLPMAAPQIASNMARTDPTSAIAWAEQLPGEAKQEAIMMVVDQWIHTDPSGARAWLSSQPDTPDNQNLLMNAAGSLLYRDPSMATEIFSSMPEHVQNSFAESMVFMQLEHSPETARDWVSQQTNPVVQEIGFIALDSTDPNVDTVSILDRIASLQSNNRENLLMNAIGQRAQTDIEPINQWLAETALLSDYERSMLTDMTNSFSSRFNSPYYPPPGVIYDR